MQIAISRLPVSKTARPSGSKRSFLFVAVIVAVLGANWLLIAESANAIPTSGVSVELALADLS
jgi:hypothetical protein